MQTTKPTKDIYELESTASEDDTDGETKENQKPSVNKTYTKRKYSPFKSNSLIRSAVPKRCLTPEESTTRKQHCNQNLSSHAASVSNDLLSSDIQFSKVSGNSIDLVERSNICQVETADSIILDGCIKTSPSNSPKISPSKSPNTSPSTSPKTSPSRSPKTTPLVGYVCGMKLMQMCDKIPNLKKRASIVHSLIAAYELCQHMKLLTPVRASIDELLMFHSGDYIQHLQMLNDSKDMELHESQSEPYGLGFDCPLQDGILEFACTLAGGSLTAARALVNKQVDVAVNWMGGWHHAQRDEASGFCYVNDIVLSILELRKTYDKILYIDLDIHHGDGVENAFSYSNKVLTLSLHKHEAGFFPGTGSLEDVGYAKGRGYSVNVPLKSGITDHRYVSVFTRVFSRVLRRFIPSAVVCQLGADCLTLDPMGGFNMTPHGLANCVRLIASARLPTLYLGGGGYNIMNTSRCWAYLTSVILNQKIPTEIPDHKYFLEYGPDYEVEITAGLRSDRNTQQEIDDIILTVCDTVEELVCD